jgi:hypothetical protein
MILGSIPETSPLASLPLISGENAASKNANRVVKQSVYPNPEQLNVRLEVAHRRTAFFFTNASSMDLPW